MKLTESGIAMINKIGLIFCCALFAGCSSISYQNGEEKLNFTRAGSMTIAGLDVTRDASGITRFRVKSSQGDMGQLGEVIVNLAEQAAKAKTP